MATSLLSLIHKGEQKWTICVYVSRMWHFRGGTDEGPIQHTDLVLLDSEGTHMYGQVPANIVDRFKDVLREGKVYVIKKFLCTPSRPTYRPVESPFMVQFTKFTMAEIQNGAEDAYPFCTYNLTALTDIPAPSGGPPARFIDVMGKITMVSNIIPVQSGAQITPSNTRTVMLVDLLGNEMRIVLWGDRAVQFDAEAVRAMGAKEPVIGIFVGLLSKMSRGILGLSGSSPCRWYIDEDIPDINSFRVGLGEQFVPLASYTPTGPDAIVPRVQQAPIDKTVLELTELDPFEEMDNRFVCTVTVESIGSEQRWWFPSCLTCRKSAKLAGNQFTCSGDTCPSVKAELTYCVSVFASDGTGKAEFVMFDKVAMKAISKPLMKLLGQRHPGYTTSEEIASVARFDATIPPEIDRLIGQKYKLLVSISKKWRLNSGENLSFQVNRIEETYKPELPPLVIPAAAESAGTSSSTGSGIQITSALPALPPLAFTPRPAITPPPAKLSPSTPARGVNTDVSTGSASSTYNRMQHLSQEERNRDIQARLNTDTPMSKGLNLPPDDYFSDWLEEDSYGVKHAEHTVYFLSRQNQKARRIKQHLENYMFVTDSGTNFTEAQFKTMLSVHLDLNYEFQLLKVEHNKFLLTLETALPADYAFAILEDGGMINIAGSTVVHYPTDEYGEGYLGGDLTFDREIQIADVQILVQIHALPLHIWTTRAVERILQPYCTVHTIDEDCFSSKTVSCLSSSCWARRGTIFPRFVILKVCTKNSHELTPHFNMAQKPIQTYCVAITISSHGSARSIPKFKLRHDFPFAQAVQAHRVGCCFLRDVDVGGDRITELRSSIILRPKQLGIELTVHDIAENLRSLAACNAPDLVVQSVGVSGYIARSTHMPLPRLLQATVGANKDIQICSQPFSWIPWSTSLDAVKESLSKKVSIRTTSMPTEFFSSPVLEDLLSPFCMFDKDGYNPGSSPDINQYMSTVWTEKKRSIPSFITVYAPPPCCRTTLDSVNKEVVPLSIMTAYNTVYGVEAEE